MYDDYKPSLDELMHYGILGMKWGKHKAKEKAYREKLSKISKNKSLGEGDIARFKYRNQHVAARITQNAASSMASMLLKDLVLGKLTKETYTNPKELRKRIISLSGGAIAKTAYKDALAKSAATKFKDNGKRAVGAHSKIWEKEDTIALSVDVALKAAPIVAWMIGQKASIAAKERKINEYKFNKWGANILPQKVSEVVWQSSDFKTAVVN